MRAQEQVEEFRVYPAGQQHVVHVPNGFGEALRVHLEAHGIRAKVSSPAATPYERVEVEGAIAPDDLQGLIDEWAR